MAGMNPDSIRILSDQAKSVTPAVVRIVSQFAKTAAKVQRLDVTADKKAALLNLARKDANAQLKPIRDDWQRIQDGVKHAVDQAMRPKAVDAAAEQRIGRAWDRVKRILDKADPREHLSLIEQHLRRAKASGDSATLAALWENAGAYVEADERDDRAREDAARLNEVLVQVAGPPEAEKAHRERVAFDRGAHRVQVAVEQAAYDLRDYGDVTDIAGSLYPGWGSEILEVPDETPTEVAEDSEAQLRSLLR